LAQRKSSLDGEEASPDLESSIQSARGSGQSLDSNLQAKMGQVMGADFSGVKVHTDSQSDQLNKSIQAKAFTTGQDVFFRQGAYEPNSPVGQELIAHELTHVVQQNGGAIQSSLMQSKKEDNQSVQYSNNLMIQCWPTGTTNHLQDRADERGITEDEVYDAIENGDIYDDPDYPGGTVYWDPDTGVTVCETSNGALTTCYIANRPKNRWIYR
jgi:hypothetical protein